MDHDRHFAEVAIRKVQRDSSIVILELLAKALLAE
jgi:hypothetical protein